VKKYPIPPVGTVTPCVCPATRKTTASLAVVLAETAFLIAYVLDAPLGR